MKVALVGPWSPEAVITLEEHRLAATGAALRAAGVDPELVLYHPDHHDQVRDRLLASDGVLVWVNPIERGWDRTSLNALLREVAVAGVMVSAHPDAIDRMGTKEVVFTTRHLGWGSDVDLYRTHEDLATRLPHALARGPRVLKRDRGSSGDGVWRVDRAGDTVTVRPAARGGTTRTIELSGYLAECATLFSGGATVLDQAYQPRLAEGMLRCYLVGDRVAGFGEQAINALYPPPPGQGPEAAPAPGPRLYFPLDRDDLQPLRHRMEEEWVPGLCVAVGIDRADLPLLWDADFFRGDSDGFVLCEINVSSVYPFPDSALPVLAAATAARLRR